MAGRRLQDPCAAGTDCLHHAANHSCCTRWRGDWSPTNAAELLRYARRRGNAPWGLAFGNELVGAQDGKWGVDAGGIEAHLSARQYAADFCRLAALVTEVWPEAQAYDGSRRPRLIAPDGHFMSSWFAEFLQRTHGAGCAPDVVAYHQYILGAGVDPQVGRKALDPAWLNRQKEHAAAVARVVRDSSAEPRPELWMSEAGGAYNSGAAGVTDAFHSSFWFLDGLGVLAQRGHHTFCRQTLAGGSYGLLNTSTLAPNPDFYALLLWRRLMGQRVLGARAAVNNGVELGHLRAYAHCTTAVPQLDVTRPVHAAGDVTLLLINLHASKSYDVQLRTPQPLAGVDEYVVSSDALSSQATVLNGQGLRAADDGSLPPLLPRTTAPSERLVVAPHTYGFFVLRGAGAPACDPSEEVHTFTRAAAAPPVEPTRVANTSTTPRVGTPLTRARSTVGAAGLADRRFRNLGERTLTSRHKARGPTSRGFAALRRLVRDAPVSSQVVEEKNLGEERRRRRRDEGLSHIWSSSEH